MPCSTSGFSIDTSSWQIWVDGWCCPCKWCWAWWSVGEIWALQTLVCTTVCCNNRSAAVWAHGVSAHSDRPIFATCTAARNVWAYPKWRGSGSNSATECVTLGWTHLHQNDIFSSPNQTCCNWDQILIQGASVTDKRSNPSMIISELLYCWIEVLCGIIAIYVRPKCSKASRMLLMVLSCPQ